MNVLLKSAKIIDAANKSLHLKTRDIRVQNGVIKRIAAKISPPAGIKQIELKNLHVSKGWFDTSISFGEPGYEERETIANGLEVAARSGFTDILLNPDTYPVPDSSGAIVFLKNEAKGKITNLHPLGALTVKGEGKDLAELYDMSRVGAVGFYDHHKPVGNVNLLKIALQYAQNFNGLIVSFPMETQLSGKGVVNEGEVSTKLGLKGIPAMSESVQVARDLSVLEYTEGKLHIPTISTEKSVRLIAEAKKKGMNVSCSVSLHHLWYTDEVLQEFESNFKILPPLRTSSDLKALRKGLADGVIDFVTTNHTPRDIEEKRVEFDHAAYGSLGLEHAFGIINQVFKLEKGIELLTRGRSRFMLEAVEIKEGSAANLTLFDPEASYSLSREDLLSTSKNSMFLGEELKGKVYGVINNNQICL